MAQSMSCMVNERVPIVSNSMALDMVVDNDTLILTMLHHTARNLKVDIILLN